MVRFFAAAAEAAGTNGQHTDAVTVAELKASLNAQHPRLGPVLAACSVLVDGICADDDAVVADSATVDVLPPFAGG